MSDFVGFKNGSIYVLDEYLEAAMIRLRDCKWEVVVILRFPDGSSEEYIMRECGNQSEAQTCLNHFMKRYENVDLLDPFGQS